MHAPSARDNRPWEFIVITDRQLLDTLSLVRPYWIMLKNAPAAIVVLRHVVHYTSPTVAFSVQDCAAATENLLLAAHDAGLGGVWLGPVSYTHLDVYKRQGSYYALSTVALLFIIKMLFTSNTYILGFKTNGALGLTVPWTVSYTHLYLPRILCRPLIGGKRHSSSRLSGPSCGERSSRFGSKHSKRLPGNHYCR